MKSILSRVSGLGMLAVLGACANGPLATLLPPDLLPFGPPTQRVADPIAEYRPAALDSVPRSGSTVSERIDVVATDVRRLQDATSDYLLRYEALTNQSASASEEYFSLTASLGVALASGANPGQAALDRRVERARELLSQLDQQRAGFSRLSAEVSQATSEANLTRADIWPIYETRGVVAADVRRLDLLEDEANRMISVLERLIYRIASDMARQSAMVEGERASLASLDSGLAMRLTGGGAVPALVTIRFDRGRPSYEDQLYQAVVAALQADPSARFDVVAVSPRSGSGGLGTNGRAQEGAEAVLRTLVEIGLPVDRVSLSAQSSSDISGGEVRVYVR